MQWTHVAFVKSEHENGRYEVKVNENGQLGCSCPAWRFNNKRFCKHTRKVMAGMVLSIAQSVG